MKIDYSKIEQVNMPAFKGGEKSIDARMFFDGKCRIMKAVVPQGASIGLHTHETSLEVILILSGRGRCICNSSEEILMPGDVHYCGNGLSHTLINDGPDPLEIFAVVPEVR
ncbi:MAG: cupin domain-containing protein [Bacteroidales bacterium]|nr:cupin domain-containing protein [Bacteroidales bacterium]